MAETETLSGAPPAAIAPAPASIEDPSRGPVAAPTSFAGFPQRKYHPVKGAMTANDPNEAASLFQPEHNWFDTAAEADAHRTDAEAQQVVHYNRRVKADGHLFLAANPDASPETNPAVTGEAGIVRNSVQATESLKSGYGEPL